MPRLKKKIEIKLEPIEDVKAKLVELGCYQKHCIEDTYRVLLKKLNNPNINK